MLSGAGGLLSRCTLTRGSHRTIDHLCLENPRPAGAEPTLTENVASPFQAEPRHPDFVKACADDTELVLLHQGAFAADYQEDECTLLGMAIKYARLPGKEVRVFGKG